MRSARRPAGSDARSRYWHRLRAITQYDTIRRCIALCNRNDKIYVLHRATVGFGTRVVADNVTRRAVSVRDKTVVTLYALYGIVVAAVAEIRPNFRMDAISRAGYDVINMFVARRIEK